MKVVWRLDRFGRSLKGLIFKVETLKDKGVQFKSLKENLGTTSSAGRLQFHIFGALSEADLPELQALMRDPDVPVRRICEWFDISKATLYRYVGPDGERRYQGE